MFVLFVWVVGLVCFVICLVCVCLFWVWMGWACDVTCLDLFVCCNFRLFWVAAVFVGCEFSVLLAVYVVWSLTGCFVLWFV